MVNGGITAESQDVISSDFGLKSRFFGDVTMFSMVITCEFGMQNCVLPIE
jgi:hypothetical protein